MSDIHDRKQARAFAGRLLAAGLIKHVVSKQTFTEKCYYVFGDGVIPQDRNSTDTSATSATTIPATTEVTYVGSPAPHALTSRIGRNVAPHRLETTTLSPVAHDQTWLRRRRDCESPMTNDYASMVGESQIGGYHAFVARQGTARQVAPPAPSQVTSSSLTNGSGGIGGPPPTPLSSTMVLAPSPIQLQQQPAGVGGGGGDVTNKTTRILRT